ncbi:MAG: DUF1844 domain-containing protein [Syntrophobacterales bacterium]|nr:DUF1844 domain-containing protein [Syntrophobacterales bacterium]
MEEGKNDKGFVIKDRRLFDEAGGVRAEAEKKADEQADESLGKEEIPSSPVQDEGKEEDYGPLPEMNFAGFIYSLATTAFYHFGDFPDPATKKPARNLIAAKQTIDILSMLKEKTEGNLEQAEKKMLEDVLYELRMRYVKEAEGK